MANIKKSFNFRNGVQVDDDNFIVNPNGLVGIGSTIPTESLDVQGNIRLRGTLYADDIETGSITNTSDTGSVTFNLVNVGITSIRSGIISASSGIVTYYGDGSKLQGLPTSQWVDVDPALNEYTSIYAVGNVGIATTNPIYTLQIGGNYSIASFANGVGIASEGDIRATRDVTIGRNLNITGITTASNLNVSGVTSISSNLYVTGITTSYSFSGFGTNITGINASNISNGTLDNDRIPININKPTGIATFNVLQGNLVGIATTARGLTTDANIDIISIVSDRSDLGITTSSSLHVTGSVGVGTDNPNSNIHLRKSSDAKLEVTSDTNASRIVVGRTVYNNNLNASSSYGIIRFGNTNVNENLQSTESSLDIINYAPGNVNYYIRPETTPNLKFNWINYSSNIILASLTNDGKLGIGKTNPSNTFEVVGTSTVTSNSFVGEDLKVVGDIKGNTLNITGSSTLNSTTFNDKVGVFANSPNYSLQIGSTLNATGTSGTGVGIGSTTGNITASGTVKAFKFVGVGSEITLINPTNISSGTLGDININTTIGIITASKFVGIGSEITLINPTNISSGTLGDININTTTGIITASKFVGIGSEITLINPTNISSGTITNVDINTTGIITASKFVGIGTQITQINPANISSGTITNVDINTTGIITATLFDGTFNTSNFLLSDVYQLNVGVGSFNASPGVAYTLASYDTPTNTNFYNLEYSLLITNNNTNYQSQVISIVGNSNVAISTEYGIVYTSSKIGFCTSDIVSNKVRLYFTPGSGVTGLTSFRYVRKRLLYSPLT
jgi:hypothetical protein